MPPLKFLIFFKFNQIYFQTTRASIGRLFPLVKKYIEAFKLLNREKRDISHIIFFIGADYPRATK
jgi:hypothetical protein